MRVVLALVTISVPFLTSPKHRQEVVAVSRRLQGDGYTLDRLSREVAHGEASTCPEGVETIDYRGTHLAYAAPVEIAAAFAPKLSAFEVVVERVAKAHYGRAPKSILHFGARSCRTIRGRGERWSEHAFGNALDVSGFQFERAPGSDKFTVLVKKHWGATLSAPQHAEFLRDLIDQLAAAQVFRGMVGPGHEGHADHFHFDQAPWHYTLF